MIIFENVSVTFDGESTPILSDINLELAEGEMVLVVGRTGSGKTTFLQTINGLVPHFTGGTLSGRVTIDGRDTRMNPPRELADLVGVVPQDPASGFVADTVEEELAFGMECLGLAPEVMRRRVEETLDLLGLNELRYRPLTTLSGGQQQRVAIGAVLTSHPKVLVLDEPTSALDPGAAEEILAALQRLVHDLGITVVLAEHRLERVVQYVDRVIVVTGNAETLIIGAPQEIMRTAPIAPPVVELGRVAGWNPLPLSVRDARRVAGPLRNLLIDQIPPARSNSSTGPDEVLAEAANLTVRYGQHSALRNVSLSVQSGEVIALMGRNGAGKSTLLNAMVGLRTPSSGSITTCHKDPKTLKGSKLLKSVGLVPQSPGDLLEATTVGEECKAADRDAQAETGATRALLDLLAPEIQDSTHPRDLSEGQRLLLALVIVLAARPPLLLLDEPTRGLDYPTKIRLVDTLRNLAAEGHAIILATHDVELAAEVSTRVIVIAEGEVVADGPTADVVVASPMFAPQIAKVMAPYPWLTVTDVVNTIGPLILRSHAPISGDALK